MASLTGVRICVWMCDSDALIVKLFEWPKVRKIQRQCGTWLQWTEVALKDTRTRVWVPWWWTQKIDHGSLPASVQLCPQSVRSEVSLTLTADSEVCFKLHGVSTLHGKWDLHWILYQKFLDEIFGRITRHAENVLGKLKLHGDDVLQSLFICVLLKWWQTT